MSAEASSEGVRRAARRAVRRDVEGRRLRSLWAQGLREALRADDPVCRCGRFPAPPRSIRQCAGQAQLWQEDGIDGAEVFIGGMERCYNASTCPWCSATVGAHLGNVLGVAVARHKAQGGEAVMVTLTLPHVRTDNLVDLIEVLDEVTRRLFRPGRNRRATRLWRRYGLATWAGLYEVMDGGRNGWGPHHHLVALLDRAELDPEELAELEAALAALVCEWERELLPGRHPSPSRVVTVEPIADGRGAAFYLTKMGLELTAGSTKAGRSGETQSVAAHCVELAQLVAGRDRAELAGAARRRADLLSARIDEYRHAMKGREWFRCAGNFWEHVPDVDARSSRAIVSAGRTLKVTDRQLMAEAAAQLRAATGTEMDDDSDDGGDDEDGPGDVPAGAKLVAGIDPDCWAELFNALDRGRVGRLLELLPLIRHGPHAAVCELVEEHGVVRGLRLLGALLRAPAGLWRDPDGVVVMTRRPPEDDWEPIDEGAA